MKTDIILAGVGGQGILSIAAALGSAALTNNLYMKQAETHGMSQRGGDVQSFMRISDRPIYSDLIAKGRADIILSVEPMDADTIAKESAGNVRASNFVMLGAASPFIEIPFEYLEEGIRAIFSRKGAEIVEMNLKALRAGREFAQNYK